MAIEYRIVESVQGLEHVTDLEIAIWGMDARFAVPGNIMSAMIHNGGLVNAAFDGAAMIGMAVAFPGYARGRAYLWSHMAGVLPSYQGQGIGLRLKLEQRAWALNAGYHEIRWTFDPIQRGNAHFNIARLGATSHTYHVDLYGVMEDGINAGMPSDRLEAAWNLEDGRVAETPSRAYGSDAAPSLPLLDVQDGLPVLHLSSAAFAVTIAVPASLTALRRRDPSLVLAWRLAIRQAFLRAFDTGYVLLGFYDAQEMSHYVLTRTAL